MFPDENDAMFIKFLGKKAMRKISAYSKAIKLMYKEV